jgi:hypothetical protein
MKMQQYDFAPNHPVLNYPNKITKILKVGLKQGLYYLTKPSTPFIFK